MKSWLVLFSFLTISVSSFSQSTNWFNFFDRDSTSEQPLKTFVYEDAIYQITFRERFMGDPRKTFSAWKANADGQATFVTDLVIDSLNEYVFSSSTQVWSFDSGIVLVGVSRYLETYYVPFISVLRNDQVVLSKYLHELKNKIGLNGSTYVTDVDLNTDTLHVLFGNRSAVDPTIQKLFKYSYLLEDSSVLLRIDSIRLDRPGKSYFFGNSVYNFTFKTDSVKNIQLGIHKLNHDLTTDTLILHTLLQKNLNVSSGFTPNTLTVKTDTTFVLSFSYSSFFQNPDISFLQNDVLTIRFNSDMLPINTYNFNSASLSTAYISRHAKLIIKDDVVFTIQQIIKPPLFDKNVFQVSKLNNNQVEWSRILDDPSGANIPWMATTVELIVSNNVLFALTQVSQLNVLITAFNMSGDQLIQWVEVVDPNDAGANTRAALIYQDQLILSGDNLILGASNSDIFLKAISLDGLPLAINQRVMQNTFVYPNPSLGDLYIQSEIQFDSYRLTNALGAIVQIGEVKDQRIDLQHLQAGLYLISLKNRDGLVSVQRVMLH